MQINSHPFSQEQLMAYLDGELPGNEAAIAAAHLQHCRECQELAADLQSVSRHLSAW
ncbi:MAG: zf-HC2 domain-containing protein, partial [Acidobacteriaceae bacterium]|nr:zf-HC2 domain-containing protein [Acidobacteriaceae bacterium]